MEQRGEISLTFCMCLLCGAPSYQLELRAHERARRRTSDDVPDEVRDRREYARLAGRGSTPHGVSTPRTGPHASSLPTREHGHGGRPCPTRPVHAHTTLVRGYFTCVEPAKDGPQTHTPRAHRTESGKVLCTPAHAHLPNSVILRANHFDLHHARPLTLVFPLPSEDTVDL